MTDEIDRVRRYSTRQHTPSHVTPSHDTPSHDTPSHDTPSHDTPSHDTLSHPPITNTHIHPFTPPPPPLSVIVMARYLTLLDVSPEELEDYALGNHTNHNSNNNDNNHDDNNDNDNDNAGGSLSSSSSSSSSHHHRSSSFVGDYSESEGHTLWYQPYTTLHTLTIDIALLTYPLIPALHNTTHPHYR